MNAIWRSGFAAMFQESACDTSPPLNSRHFTPGELRLLHLEIKGQRRCCSPERYMTSADSR